MISVLIPTYNFNCYPFVQELHKQLSEVGIGFQVICLDDGSKSDQNIENDKINNLSSSYFEALENNLGRSAIRNLLVKKANYDWLLFLDADGFPKNNNFIQLYVDFINEKNDYSACIGGRIHKNEKRKNLRIKFGLEREEVSVSQRNKNPYRFLFTSNMLLNKGVFNETSFNESLTGYGYEDVLFGNSIRDLGHKVLHINNPVYHLHIEENKVFVDKTKQGLANLFFLKNQKLVTEDDIKLLKYFNTIEKFKITNFLKKRVDLFANLAIKTSSLTFYDLFKLSYLCGLKDKKKI